MASIHVHDDAPPARVDRAIAAVLTELERLEAMFSTFRPDSEISRVNRGELTLGDCSPEVHDVLDACTWLEHASGGAFNLRPRGPDHLDPAGFVKGWATERAAHGLRAAGLGHWYLAVGGDLLTAGRPEPDRLWHIAVADPLRPGHTVAELEVTDLAVATSGTAERGAHLWDGRTGRRAGGLASVTVVGPSLTWADAFATTAFALGPVEGPAWVTSFEGYDAITVGLDGTVRATSGLPPTAADPITAAHPPAR